MRTRFALMFMLVVAAVAAAMATTDPMAVMIRSDALYGFPTQQGVTDLAVELRVEEFAANPALKDVRFVYYYAGPERQKLDVLRLPAQYARMRDGLLNLAAPLVEYILPRSAAETMQGFDVKVSKANRQIAGVSGTTFDLLVGTARDKEAQVQEYRMLLDPAGYVHQVENTLANKSRFIARIESVKVGEKWHIGKVTQRIALDKVVYWRIDTITYKEEGAYVLPATVSVQFRNAMNLPMKGMDDLTVHFEQYRINTGAAAEAVPAPAPAGPPAPAEAPKTE